MQDANAVLDTQNIVSTFVVKPEGPISNSADDKLRRIKFAERIAEVLSQSSSDGGRVYAIRGKWGDGKTSLMNLITEKMKGEEWILFNPWSWGDSEAIAKALFQEIANKLKTGHSKDASKRAKAFRRYGKILTQAEGPLKAFGESSTVLGYLLGGTALASLAGSVGLNIPKLENVAIGIAMAALALPLLGQLLTWFGTDKWSEPIEDIKDSLSKSLKNLERPLIVFVDDIDRLEEQEIRSLIMQVKANASFPNIVFVLLHQQSTVESALDSVANGNGRDFLEKIVQMSFDLPAVPRNTVHKIFTDELSLLASQFATHENGFEEVRWGNLSIGCIQPFVNNLRDARRLVSSLAIHLPLHSDGDFFEVNIIDLLVLETLRVFEPDFHAALFKNQDLIIGSFQPSDDGRRAARKKQLEQLIDLVREDLRPAAKDALTQLFPQTESIFGGVFYDGSFHEEWRNAKRVCSQRFFPKYFELQTPLGEISVSEFEHFISVSGDKEQLNAFLENVREREVLPSLISMLDEFVKKLPTENASTLLPTLFEIAEESAEEAGPSVFDSTYTQGWRATSWYIRFIPELERGQQVIAALRKTEALKVTSTIIHLNEPSDQKDKGANALQPALTSETLKELKSEWLSFLRKLAEDGEKLLYRDDLISLLYRWRDYSGSMSEPRSWVDSVVADDLGFCTFLKRATSVSWTTTIGDRVSKRVEGFEKSVISDFIGVAEAQKRIMRLKATMLDGQFSQELENLADHIELWLQDESRENTSQ